MGPLCLQGGWGVAVERKPCVDWPGEPRSSVRRSGLRGTGEEPRTPGVLWRLERLQVETWLAGFPQCRMSDDGCSESRSQGLSQARVRFFSPEVRESAAESCPAGVGSCARDVAKPRRLAGEVSHGRLGRGLGWRPLRDEASGREARFGGRRLRMCLSCVVLGVRDPRAGRRGWTPSFPPGRVPAGGGEGRRV